ncbi:MAG: hypothetical protein WBW93_14455 [Steroidobacteraceae bacterium]
MPKTVASYANGSYMTPGQVNEIQDDIARQAEVYKELISATSRLDAPASGGPYLLGSGSSGSGVAASNAAAGLSVFYFNPEWVLEKEPVSRSTFLRLRVSLLTNAVAPAITFTAGLYSVTACAGAEATSSITLGSALTGSTVAFASPPKEELKQASTEDFAAPAAGFYALGVAVSGAAAAKSSVAIRALLQVHEV